MKIYFRPKVDVDNKGRISMFYKYLKYSFLSALLLAVGSAYADHLPDAMLAKGKPEVELAGINLEKSKLDDVIRRYGQPAHKLNAPNNPAWAGYSWEMPHAKLEVNVEEGPKGAEITDIYIAGTSDAEVGLSGQGLKIGDTLTDLKRIYGPLFELSAPNRNPSGVRDPFTGVQEKSEYQVATLQWQSWDFTLRVGFNAAGKVDAMWLILPECYPSGCD